MAMPPALQRYANEIVKGTYKEISKYWNAIQAKNSDLPKEMLKLSTTGRLDGRIIDALRRVHDSLRKGAANVNNRGHRSEPAGKAPRPARSGTPPPLAELRLLDADSILIDEDGNPAPSFDADQLSYDSVGVSFTSEKKAADAIILHLNEDTFNEASSMICKSTLLEKASSE